MQNYKLNFKIALYFIIVILIFAFLIFIFVRDNSGVSGEYDDFAMCLTRSGITMYGTKTCPYCAKQKQMFGDSFRFIKYVECTVETQKCTADGVRGVPLWTFPDGSRLTGLQQLGTLAQKTGCTLPPSP